MLCYKKKKECVLIMRRIRERLSLEASCLKIYEFSLRGIVDQLFFALDGTCFLDVIYYLGCGS